MRLPCEGHYQFVGRCRPLRINRKGALSISCLVYEQLVQEPALPSFREVAACGWSPCTAVLGNEHVRRLNWSLLSGQTGSGWDGYPSVLLPMMDLVQPRQRDPVSVADRFVLWGLTLHIINNMLVQCKLRDTPIDPQLLDSLDSKSYPDDSKL